jgi:hemerythrin-like domain-containing protein
MLKCFFHRLKRDAEQLLSNKFRRSCSVLELTEVEKNHNFTSTIPCFIDIIKEHLIHQEDHNFTLFVSTPLSERQTDIVSLRAQRQNENTVHNNIQILCFVKMNLRYH